MKLLEPLIVGSYTISQKFGGNANPYYKENELAGHPGVDMYQGYDHSITASHDALVYSVINKNNPYLSKYRAVCTIFQDNGEWYELIYGHCDKIYVSPGDVVHAGDLLASVGNTGDVYSGGKAVSPSSEVRLKPPYPGTHLHWQLRQLVRTDSTGSPNYYLLTSQGVPYQDKEGKYFEIPNYKSGFNGCIDPLPFLYSPTSEERTQYYENLIHSLAKVTSDLTAEVAKGRIPS